MDSRAGTDDLKRKMSGLCRDSNPVVSGYTTSRRLWRQNLSTANVVDIPSDLDGYSSLETAVPPISHRGNSSSVI